MTTRTVALTTLAVAAGTEDKPLLNTIIYRKNPKKPLTRNRGQSTTFGGFIFVTMAMTISAADATRYRRNPSDAAEKYDSVMRVNTNANAQQNTVASA